MKMKYNENILRQWLVKSVDEEYLTYGEGLFAEDAHGEKYKEILEKYKAQLETRISYCKNLLKEYDNDLIYYTLASLYDRFKPQTSIDSFFKRSARYYALKAIKRNSYNAPAWVLLAKCYRWLSIVGKYGNDDVIMVIRDALASDDNIENEGVSYVDIDYELDYAQKRSIKYLEKAIYCIKKALEIKPSTYYKKLLKDLLNQKNQEYKPSDIARIINL